MLLGLYDSAADETRVAAFLALRKLAVAADHSLRETVIKVRPFFSYDHDGEVILDTCGERKTDEKLFGGVSLSLLNRVPMLLFSLLLDKLQCTPYLRSL